MTWKAYHNKHDSLGPLALLNGAWWYDSTRKAGTVPIRTASYDAATHAVTLVASRPLHYDKATGGIGVTDGRRGGGSAATPAPAHPRPGLTDAGGLPIEAVYSLGRFVVNVFPVLHPGL